MDTGINFSGPDSKPAAKRWFRWWWFAPATVLVCLMALGAAAYAERLRLATYVAQRYLAAYGIRSEIEIGRLSWGGVLARVEAGPADAPDFTADAIEISLAYPDTSFTGWTKPQIAAVRLIHPFMRVSYDGTKPTFGSLQPLVDETLASPSDAPKPRVAIENGNLLLTTPNGTIDLVADATVTNGRPDHLKASLKKTTLKGSAFAADIVSASLIADFVGDSLTATFALSADRLSYEGRNLRGVVADASTRALAWNGNIDSFNFTTPALVFALKAATVETPELAAGVSTSRVSLQNVAGSFAGKRLQASAKGDVTTTLAGLSAGDALAAMLEAQTTLASFMLDVSPNSSSATADAHVIVRGRDAQYNALGRTISLGVFATEFDSTGTAGTDGASGRAHGVLSVSGNVPRALALRSLSVNFDGTGAIRSSGPIGTLVASLTASANVPRDVALVLAHAIPGLGADEAIASAIADSVQVANLKTGTLRVTRSRTGLTVTSASPVTLDSMNGARVALTPRGGLPLADLRGNDMSGGFGLDIRGGRLPELQLSVATYRYRHGATPANLTAGLQFVTALDYGALRGVRLSGAGTLDLAGENLSFASPDCLDFSLAAYRDGGSDQVRDANGRLCGSRLQIGANRIAFNSAGCADLSLATFASGGVDLIRDVKTRLCGPELQIDASRIAFHSAGCSDLSLAALGSNGVDLVRNMKAHLCGASVQMAGSRVALSLPGCGDFSLESFRNNETAMIADAKTQLCGIMNRPLLVANSGDWQVDGRWAQASAQFVPALSAIAEANGTIVLAGQAGEILTGTVTLATGRVSDVMTVPRFLPLSANGAMKANGPDWLGQFLLTSTNSPVASVTLRHSLTTAAGEARIETPALVFVPKALQPENLAPFLAAFGKDVSGPVDFKGRVAWSKDGLSSKGILVLSGTDLRSPFGMVRQIRGNLELTSLLPVALAPGQTVTVNRVETFVPLEQVTAKFTYTPEGLNLEQVSANVAEGRVLVDPIAYRFAPGSTSSGTLRLQNVNLTPLLAAAGLADRVTATTRIDGIVPFSMGPEGVRFANGKVAANAPGRLSIKREALSAAPGVGGAPEMSSNAVQDFAYQALENLSYDQLEGTVNSRPMGRLGLLLHVKGRNDPVKVAETRVGLFDLLRGRGFDKPLPLPKGTPVDLTLDTSVNLDELLNAYFNRTVNVSALEPPAK